MNKKLLNLICFIFLSFFIFHLKADALDEGIYIIHSTINDNYVLDANDAVAANGTNVQLFYENGGLSQKWIVKKVDNDYYEIYSTINDSFALDINGAVFNNSTNIQLWNTNHGFAQKWKIQELENGNYKLLSYNDAYSLDANGAVAYNYTNIQLWNSNNTLAQQFKFEKCVDMGKNIENGIYTISSAVDSNKVFDVTGGVFNNNTNIQLYSSHGADAQKYYISYVGNGYYNIKSYSNMNYAFTVNNNGNIELQKYNGSKSQLWIFSELSDGNYSILSAKTLKSIDLYGNGSSNGTNVATYNYHGGNNQKFIFNKIELTGSNTIANGHYIIKPISSVKKAVDIYGAFMKDKTNVELYSLNYGLAQKWYVEYLDNGYYKIVANKDNNYSLQVDGTNVNIAPYSGADNQQWMIRKVDGGYYLISKTGYYLDLYGGSIADQTNIQIYPFNGSNAQKFNFVKTADGISSKVIDSAMYNITSKADTNMNIDLNAGVASDGTNIQLWYKNATEAQKFYVSYSNGYYKISSVVNTDKLFDVDYASTQVGANVSIYQNTNAINQQWILKDAGDGYYYIISNCNGLYLDSKGTNSGSNVYLNEFTGSDSQKFRFTVTRIEKLVIDVSAWNGDIDWETVAYKSGIYGVILRVSAGTAQEDAKLAQNIEGVKKYGIPYGLYIYNYATDYVEGAVNGLFVKNIMNKYSLNPTLGIFLDLERNSLTEHMGPNEYNNVVSGFLNIIPGGKIYSYTYYLNTALNNDYLHSNVGWVAQYGPQCTYNGWYYMWQFTSSGQLPGINGNVDMSYYYIY